MTTHLYRDKSYSGAARLYDQFSGISAAPLLTLALTVILLAIAITDVREMRIPDVYNALIFCIGLLACALLHHQTVLWGLKSAVAGLIGMQAIRLLYLHFRHRNGLGLGDVKFTAAAGAWIGLEELPLMILIAAGSALACVALLSMFSSSRLLKNSAVPFGPFLAISLWTLWSLSPFGVDPISSSN